MKPDLDLQNFVYLIQKTTGIKIREPDYPRLAQQLLQRVKHLGLASLRDYYHQLAVSDSTLTTSLAFPNSEWHNLLSLITVPESYFFRDRNQFHLLQNHLLPHLIQTRLQQRSTPHLSTSHLSTSHLMTKPQLRLWSAGCSTGEEAYSLAIILDQLLDRRQWDLQIIGTDICQQSLAKARRGIFSAWSFRQCDPRLQEKYFDPHPQGWKIRSDIQSLVTFELRNLLFDSLHFSNLKPITIDLILCRNVFIYLELAAIEKILSQFLNFLQPQGYLLTGHAELQGCNLQGFQLLNFPESAVYQPRTSLRPIASQALPRSQESLPQSPASSSTQPLPSAQKKNLGSVSRSIVFSQSKPSQPPTQTLQKPETPQVSNSLNINAPPATVLEENVLEENLAEAKRLSKTENDEAVIVLTQQILKSDPNSVDAHLLLGQAYANLGQHQQAEKMCERLLTLHPFNVQANVQAYLLLAQISEDRGDLEQTKTLLKRIIYLDPRNIMAHFHLSFLYEQEGNQGRATKLRVTALALVEQALPSQIVDYQQNLTAQDIEIRLKRILAETSET